MPHYEYLLYPGEIIAGPLDKKIGEDVFYQYFGIITLISPYYSWMPDLAIEYPGRQLVEVGVLLIGAKVFVKPHILHFIHLSGVERFEQTFILIIVIYHLLKPGAAASPVTDNPDGLLILVAVT
jgi:hypothetical protein